MLRRDFTNESIEPLTGDNKGWVTARRAAARNVKPPPKALTSRLPLFFEPEKPVVQDPLAPFIAKAKAEVEEERLRGVYPISSVHIALY